MQRCSIEILAKMFDGGCAGDQQDVGRALKNHARATCIGVACSDAAAASSADDCNGLNPPSGKNGT